MKIALINPPGGYYAARWDEGSLPSLGIGYLAAYLEKYGYNCEIIDAHVMRWSLNDLLNHLRNSKPDIVGITLITENRFEGFKTIKAICELLPTAVIIAGGPHVSTAAHDTLEHIPELDIVVRGEGEETLLELVRVHENGGSLTGIAGISYRQGTEIIHEPERPFIRDLDSLPFPARHLMPMNLYKFTADIPGLGRVSVQNIMTSRGCPFTCSFCASSRMWGRSYRSRSVENILSEINELINVYGAKALWIFDDTFTVNRAKTITFCNELIRRFDGIKWFCEIRVDTVDFELLSLMKKAGCYCVAFGVESGSQRIIDESIGKKIKLEQVDQVVSWCRQLGLQYNPFMIISHPGETEDEALMSMNLVKEWKADGAQVSMAIMHVYPGTNIEKIAREKGIIPSDFSWALESDLKRVPMLPAAQGKVPIFLDKLSWNFISKCLFEWADMQHYSVLKKIPKVLASIHSVSDMKRYSIMLMVYAVKALTVLMQRIQGLF